MASLEFTSVCPKCGRREKGKRRAGSDTILHFACKGKINIVSEGKLVPCGQRFSLNFFDEDSEEERSKANWLAGHDSEWTDGHLK